MIMDKQDFKEALKELLDELYADKNCSCEIPQDTIPKYDSKKFIHFIMDTGKQMYHSDLDGFDSEEIFSLVSEQLMKKLDLEYVIVRKEFDCIAIATPCYIQNAKVEISKALGIIPEAFTEISGPMSTVLIIDCEKQYLRKAYLGITEDQWLL